MNYLIRCFFLAILSLSLSACLGQQTALSPEENARIRQLSRDIDAEDRQRARKWREERLEDYQKYEPTKHGYGRNGDNIIINH